MTLFGQIYFLVSSLFFESITNKKICNASLLLEVVTLLNNNFSTFGFVVDLGFALVTG